jgi:hypothetical protein
MQLDTIIPSFHSPDLTACCIRSIERYKPASWQIRHIVVENSGDTSYRARIESLGNVLWVQHPTDKTEASANAEGIKIGSVFVRAPWVLILHCDTFVTSEKFFAAIEQKINDGYRLIGTQRYPNPSAENCYHCSGIVADAEIACCADYSKKRIDACEDLTFYCRERNIKRNCFRNTFNMPELVNTIPDKWRGLHVDRCVDDDNNVIFLHLGRGIPKTRHTYNKPNRVYLKEWLSFCRGYAGWTNM